MSAQILSMPCPACDQRRVSSLKIAAALEAGGVTSEELSSFDPEIVYIEICKNEIVRQWSVKR